MKLKAALVILILSIASTALSATLAEQVAESGRPHVIDLGGDSCPACLEQKKVFDAITGKFSDSDVVFRTVDAKKERKLVMPYRIFITPTIIFLDSKGEEVHRNVGLMEAEPMEAKLKELGWINGQAQ